MYLCLGEILSFEELYLTVATLRVATFSLVYPGLLSASAMALVHWMVATYYTTYKSVVPHFLPDDIEKLLQKEKKASKVVQNSAKLSKIEDFILAEKGQTMIVFPDLWTLYGMI
jgi:primosomal protein N'